MIQTLTRDIQYNDMVLSVMIYELYSPWDDVILSYGLFYCIGLCLVCGVLCTWCGLTERIVMLGLKILLTGKILVNEKGAVVRYDD